MDKKSLKKLQELQLENLLNLYEFCKKNDINFYLGEGTLLGAIRHHGFIPWDDDIDILMTKEDYDRFLELAPYNLDKNYKVQHSTLLKDYWSPFIKVRYIGNTPFKQQHISHLTDENGPCIDIFPLYYVKDKTNLTVKYRSLKIRILRRTLSIKLGLNRKRNIRNIILKIFGSFVNTNTIHKLLIKTFNLNNKGDYLANFGSYYKITNQVFPKDFYGEGRLVKFENFDLPVPVKAEEILSSIYGDYMQLPPEDKRVIKHHYNVDIDP